MSTQSIIIYRNPLEQAFWETFMGSEYTFPVIVCAVVYIISIVLVDSYITPLIQKIYKKITKKCLFRTEISYLPLILALVPTIAVFKTMV